MISMFYQPFPNPIRLANTINQIYNAAKNAQKY